MMDDYFIHQKSQELKREYIPEAVILLKLTLKFFCEKQIEDFKEIKKKIDSG